MKNFAFLSFLFVLILISGCSESKKSINKLDDLKDVSIGAMTGTTGEQLAKKRFPDATVKSFDDIMDAVAALKSNQLDAVITGYPAAMNVCKHNPDLQYLSEPVDYENTAIAVKKGNDKFLESLSNFITELENDGTLKDMRRRWFKTDLGPYDVPAIELPSKGEVLRIGTSATREPFCFIDKDRNVTGYDGELARRISTYLNRPIQFVDMKFAALIPALQSGKIDMIVAGMTATEARKKSVDFTKSYFKNSQVILAKKEIRNEQQTSINNTKLKTIDDLKNKKLGVLLGSVHDTYAFRAFPNSQVLQYKNPSELILAVRSGKVDAAMYTHETLLEILRTDHDLKIFGDTLFSVPIGMGFNKNNSVLKEKFNQFLKKIKKDGTFDDMIHRWITLGQSEMPMIKNSGANGTLVIGTVSDKGLPFTIVKNGKLVGFDIELAERFAASLDKKIKFADMEFGSLIISAVTNKIEMITSTLMITEERKKQIDFSDPYMKLGASVFALKKNIGSTGEQKLHKLEDLSNKNVGVYEGTIDGDFVAKKIPTANVMRFIGSAEMILAVKTEKVDAGFLDLIETKGLLKSENEIGILTENAMTKQAAFGFSKSNQELKKKFNSFLKSIKANGEFDKIYKRWCIGDFNMAKMPAPKYSSTSKVLKVGVTAMDDLPYLAFIDGRFVGLDIELLQAFAEANGYKLEVVSMEYPALFAAVNSGKVDVIADGIAITNERKKLIDFSDSYKTFNTAVIALKKNLASYSSIEQDEEKFEPSSITKFFNSVAESFHNNIVVENRYLLIIDGLKTTVLISILATILGTLFGGLICFMRMSKKKLLSIPAKIYIALLRGTPVLVILMIIFYVVFASVDIDPIIVAIIAFGMNFAAYVSEMYRTGIEGVDKGQTEAGIAMGFTKVQTFLLIILPQAARRILPVYKGELISLVKMTSIVGYIAVQDLTKASDIIRSRTFDAFFPLIMVAVLYFLISWLLLLLLGYLERITNPKLKVKRG